MINNFVKLYLPVLFVTIFFIQGCEENPTDLGSGFISPDDTLNTQLLTSDNDSIIIISSVYTKAFANSISPFLMVGKTTDITSMGLLKFTAIPAGFEDANVTSAFLILKYNNYYYTDSLGNLDFDIYNLTQNFTYSTVTSDSVNKGSYGTKSVGTYKGVLKSEDSISISLDNQLVKDWLEFAADPKYPVGNYGMIFIPNNASNSVRGFFSSDALPWERPHLEITMSVEGKDTTILTNISETTFIAESDLSAIPQNRIVLQGGVAVQNFIRFSLEKLPPNVIVNDARLELTLDSANSFFFPVTDRRIIASVITDSSTYGDSLSIINSQIIGDKYVLQFPQFVQFWNNGTFQNYGLGISTLTKRLNIDRFVFYSPGDMDPTRHPKLTIRYTIRN